MPAEDDDLTGLEDQAADWVVRQDGAQLSKSERRALADWLSVPAHKAAYERHRAVWGEYRQAGAQGFTPRIAGQPRRKSYRPRAAPRRRQLAGAAIAASLALLVVGYTADLPMRLRADHVTGAGERRTLALADGSTVQLDGRSAISFDRTASGRTLRLLAGAAAVQVAPDPLHPFIVQTDAGSVTALGTAFTVREAGGGIELTVTQHRVAVETEQGRRLIVHEGEGTTFAPDLIDPARKVDIHAATAWTRGKLFVTDRPLGEVVAAIGRQRLGYWTARGDAAAIRVNGVYDLDDPLAALAVLERTLDLRSFRLSDRIIILSR